MNIFARTKMLKVVLKFIHLKLLKSSDFEFTGVGIFLDLTSTVLFSVLFTHLGYFVAS